MRLLACALIVVSATCASPTAPSSKILSPPYIVSVSAQLAVTTSEEYFREAGVVSTADIRSGRNNFKDQFIGLEVGAVMEAELAVRKLKDASYDSLILPELGDKAEISVSQFRAFLAENYNHQSLFIFYLRGKDRNLWVVDAGWFSTINGWSLHADPISGPDRWHGGGHVVSLN